MRVVLVPQGTHGDVRPLVALGTALRAAGHHVLFGVSPDHRHWLQGLGFEVHCVARFMEAPSDEADRSVGRPLRMLWSGLKFVMDLVPSQFADLEPLLEGADLIVGSGLEFAGRSLAERHWIKSSRVPLSSSGLWRWLVNWRTLHNVPSAKWSSTSRA